MVTYTICFETGRNMEPVAFPKLKCHAVVSRFVSGGYIWAGGVCRPDLPREERWGRWHGDQTARGLQVRGSWNVWKKAVWGFDSISGIGGRDWDFETPQVSKVLR
jgi:hypothetical protein